MPHTAKRRGEPLCFYKRTNGYAVGVDRCVRQWATRPSARRWLWDAERINPFPTDAKQSVRR